MWSCAVHALRHTFGTHLSKNSVAARRSLCVVPPSTSPCLPAAAGASTLTPGLLAAAGAGEALPDLGLAPLDDHCGG